MTTIKLDAGSFISHYSSKVIDGVNAGLQILLLELKRLTPEDTGNMLQSYRTTSASLSGRSVVGSITNDSGYAIYVEYGTSGLTFNYHKPKGTVFYQGVGNRTFARAVDNVKDRVIQAIYDEINK